MKYRSGMRVLLSLAIVPISLMVFSAYCMVAVFVSLEKLIVKRKVWDQ